MNKMQSVFAGMAVIFYLLCPGVSHGEVNAYVPNRSTDSVTVFPVSDLNVPEDEIDVIEIGTGAMPFATAAHSEGKYVYVVNMGNNTVSFIKTENIDNDNDDDDIWCSVYVGTAPYDIAVSSDDDYLFVSNSGSGSVSVIDITDIDTAQSIEQDKVSTIDVGTTPYGLAIDGDTLYVINNGDDNISVIDISDKANLPDAKDDNNDISVGDNSDGPTCIALAPIGNLAYVTNNISNSISVIDIGNPAEPPIEINTDVITIPYGIAISPDEDNIYDIYVANYSDSNVLKYSISSTSGLTAESEPEELPTGNGPYGITLSLANAGGFYYVYVGNSNNGRIAVVGSPDDSLSGIQYAGNMLKDPHSLNLVVVSGTRIDLSWEYEHFENTVYTDVPGFMIDRDMEGYNIAIDTVDPGELSFIHSNLRPKSTYAYSIRAYLEFGDLEYYSIPLEGEEATLPEEDEDCFIETAISGMQGSKTCLVMLICVLGLCLTGIKLFFHLYQPKSSKED